MKFIISSTDSGQRIDQFLSKHYSFSRTEVKKIIQSEKVKIGEKIAFPGYYLKPGDKISAPSQQEIEAEIANKIEQQKEKLIGIKVIAETEEYLIINKPAGIICHRAPNIKEPSLVDWVLEKYPEIKTIGEDEWRPGLVHRLDREVSGLVIVARTQESFLDLKSQFQNRQVKKEYLALVYGVIKKESDEINFLIKRSEKKFKMASIPVQTDHDPKARDAKTYFQVLDRKSRFTLLKIKIFTGRTHQIRTHLAAYGHPIVGDNIYGNKKSKEKNQKIRKQEFLNKCIFLTANTLGFKDLSGKTQEFSIEMPTQLEEFLKTLN